MVKVGDLSTRANPTPNDLVNKQRLLNNRYRYWISFIVIECLSNTFSRILLDSIISYVY